MDKGFIFFKWGSLEEFENTSRGLINYETNLGKLLNYQIITLQALSRIQDCEPANLDKIILESQRKKELLKINSNQQDRVIEDVIKKMFELVLLVKYTTGIETGNDILLSIRNNIKRKSKNFRKFA